VADLDEAVADKVRFYASAREHQERPTVRLLLEAPERKARGEGDPLNHLALLSHVFLADVIDWVGVAVGVIGAIVVAPDGFKEFLRSLARLPVRLWLWLRRVVLRKPQRHEASLALTLPAVTLSGWGTLSGGKLHEVDQSAPIEEQVPQLVLAVTILKATMTKLVDDLAERDRQNRERAEQATEGLSEDIARVIESIKEAGRAAAKFNARGLPLVALGILMTGPNSILAKSIWFGWCLVGAAIALIVYGIWPWLPWRPKDSAATG
jgi:hypothetical protein